MVQFMLFLHALGALAVGFYLLFPFLAGRLKGLSPQAQDGFARVLRWLNRIGQWLLVVQLATGGYLASKYGLSTAWMIVVLVMMLALFAATGMMGGPLKRIAADGGSGKAAAAADVSKLTIFGGVSAVLVLVLLVLMYYTNW